MNDIAPISNGKVLPVPSASFHLSELVDLLGDYTKTLNIYLDEISKPSARKDIGPLDQASSEELLDAIRYLYARLSKIVDVSSSYREHINMDDGQKLRFDLRLFEAEAVLRRATRIFEKRKFDLPS